MARPNGGQREDSPQGGPPALGLHLLMGEPTKVMLGNIQAMIQEGILEPVELIAHAV